MSTPTQAGRELDALIAEKVMGLKPREVRISGTVEMATIYTDSPFYSGDTVAREHLWHVEPKPYSTEMAEAWKVVEKLRIEGHWLLLSEGKPSLSSWWYGRDTTFLARIGSGAYAEADTAPLAICLAALIAVSAEVPA